MCSPPVWNWSPISAKFSGGFVPRPTLSPYVPRGYDDRFFWIDPCILRRVCYNIHMNENETLEDYDWDQDQYDDCALDACWDL